MGLACCMAAMAQAKIIRVSNVEGSTAPYKTFAEAYAVAEAGDTLLFDGSETNYGDIIIGGELDAKPIVLLGSGYDLIENNITELNNSDVKFDEVVVCNSNVILQGITCSYMYLQADGIVVNRCKGNNIVIGSKEVEVVSNIVIHQCHFRKIERHGFNYYGYLTNSQITNNIFFATQGLIMSDIKHSVIHNNTFAWEGYGGLTVFCRVYSCSIKNNCGSEDEYASWTSECAQNEFENNGGGPLKRFGKDIIKRVLDSKVMEVDAESTANGYGAFAGTDPYVISGVPAGPVIEDIEMPVSVEKGKKLEVTVKVKIQK